MRRECKYHAHFTGMDIEFGLEWRKKVITKNKQPCQLLTRLFLSKLSTSYSCTVIHRFFFFWFVMCLKHRVTEGRIEITNTETKKLAECLSYISLLAEVSHDEAKNLMIFASSWETSASREELYKINIHFFKLPYWCLFIFKLFNKIIYQKR